MQYIEITKAELLFKITFVVAKHACVYLWLLNNGNHQMMTIKQPEGVGGGVLFKNFLSD